MHEQMALVKSCDDGEIVPKIHYRQSESLKEVSMTDLILVCQQNLLSSHIDGLLFKCQENL